MSTLVLYNNKSLSEFPVNALPGDLPEHFHTYNLTPNVPLAEQATANNISPTAVGENVFAFIATDETQYFSVKGVNPLRIGNAKSCHIRLHSVLAEIAVFEKHIHIMSMENDKGVYLNGKKVEIGEYPINFGDFLWIGLIKIVVYKGYIECSGKDFSTRLNISVTRPEPYSEFPIYKRSPRIIKRQPTGKVELAAPKQKEERKKAELLRIILPPMMTSAVMVGGSLMIGRGLFILIGAAAMLVSVVFSATIFITDRKVKLRKEKERDEKYDMYLLEKRKEIHNLYQTQRESLLYHNLSPKEIEKEIMLCSDRVYERAANDSDFLTISPGNGIVSPSFEVSYKTDIDSNDPLAEEMKELGSYYHSIKDMPVTIDLKGGHLGLVGEKSSIHRELHSIITQLCFFQSYHDIEIVILLEEEYREKFEWIRWYPHCKNKNINVTGIITAENQRDQALGNISQVLKMRRQKQEEEKKDSKYLPHYIFIIDNPKLIINHSIMEYLQANDTTLGFSVIYTTHLQSNLPENIKTVLLLTGGDQGILVMNEGELLNMPLSLHNTAGVNFEIMARKSAPLIHTQGISTQIPESISFFELYNVKRPEELPVIELWKKNSCHKSLAVPLGLRGKEDIVSLNLHEKAHGPHGLVAGTTGSGKSEIVQSYILSLAVNFHPHEVGFLLIDYKGGGMANLFANLPHLLGTITNLDGSESMRALASIKSELARRQRIFNDNSVNNINQYTKLFKSGEAALPLPHLFIISDEFAELKKEQPDFMSELVSTARIGRSLGVHLILATQKPTGVVDDQIWSNSKFKLALKVANEGDSAEVLKTPDAARITVPGRAYLQVGNNEIYELFQSAWSGAPYSEEVVERGFDSRVYIINKLGQGVLLNEDLSKVETADDSRITQLDAVVNHISEIYNDLNSATVEKPWLPPLNHKIVTNHITTGTDVGMIHKYNLDIPVAVVDIPEEQRQTEYTHNFLEAGNMAVFGASGFGKSTTLMNIALTLAANNSPRFVNFFVLDYGNSALAQLKGLPHTADYLNFEDEEKLNKLKKLLSDDNERTKTTFCISKCHKFQNV